MFEVHKLNGRGYSRKQYEDAVYTVIDALADRLWTDHDLVSFAVEKHRREYPVPSGFVGIHAMEVLAKPPVTSLALSTMDTWRALGDATARTRLSQGFQVPSTGFYSYIAFFMDVVGAPTDNLSCVVETDSSAPTGRPSGTAVTNGTSASIAGTVLTVRGRYLVFVFDPMFLTESTTYHATLRRSAAVDSSNYYRVGEDTGGGYGDGTLATWDTSTWTPVSGSDLIFSVSGFPVTDTGPQWTPLGPTLWELKNLATDQLEIKTPGWWSEGTPVRVVGGAAIARPSTESTNVPARPDFVIRAAKAILTGNLVGQPSQKNHAQAAQWFLGIQGLSTPAARQYPANWRPITA